MSDDGLVFARLRVTEDGVVSDRSTAYGYKEPKGRLQRATVDSDENRPSYGCYIKLCITTRPSSTPLQHGYATDTPFQLNILAVLFGHRVRDSVLRYTQASHRHKASHSLPRFHNSPRPTSQGTLLVTLYSPLSVRIFPSLYSYIPHCLIPSLTASYRLLSPPHTHNYTPPPL